jgi:hypothetical protein
MKLALTAALSIIVLGSAVGSLAQTRRSGPGSRPSSARSHIYGKMAIVGDETLSVLRAKPTLFSEPIQRMRRGRKVQILGVSEADGVRFYRVTAPPSNSGWVQADALFGTFDPADEKRMASLVQASSGFEQIEVAVEFLELYPKSSLRPAILLLFGDLLEMGAGRLSREAGSRLNRKEMAASGAPLHSFYLNYVGLDRYRRLGIGYLFNSSTRQFHYDGASWKEIITKFSASAEADEARKRLAALQEKLTVKETAN